MDRWEKLRAEITSMLAEIPEGVFKVMEDPKPSMYKISIFKGKRAALENVLAQMDILERNPEP